MAEVLLTWIALVALAAGIVTLVGLALAEIFD